MTRGENISDEAKLITSPWRKKFESFITSARGELWIAAPYYSNETVKFILTKARKGVSKRFLLALSENAVTTGSQSIAAIRMMRDDKLCRVQFIKDLHAKFLIKDKKHAVVTSSNLTNAGLDSNIEMGMLVDDSQTVGDLTRQFHELWLKSEAISKRELDKYDSHSTIRQGGKAEKSFGGIVRFGKRTKHPSPNGAVDRGWILIHSPTRWRKDFPKDELPKKHKSGSSIIWHWKGGKPMKEGGPYILLLAYKQKIFGEAKAKITRDIEDDMRPKFNFAFELRNYKPLKKEIPFDNLPLGERKQKHHYLIKLDDKILAAYRAKREGGGV